MSASHSQPLPKSPPERTLQFAAVILIVVALVQLVAAGIALAPRLDYEKWARSLASHPAASTPASTASAQQGAENNSSAAYELLAEAQKFREENNFRGALEAVTEADRLMPNKASILIQMAGDNDQLGNNAETIAVLKRIVALPQSSDPTDASYREQAQKILMQMLAAGGANAASPATGAAPSSAPATASASTGARDDIGIPIGSVMGIVDAKLLDGEPGQKNLRVSTKRASDQKIDPLKFQATVDFYEQDDHGQIIHNDSPRPNEWLSGPAIDWANADPEIFQVKYRMPLEDRGDLPPLQYYGYVVAIYYNGELQDQRADPPTLLNQYAPSLHKDLPVE